jgi:hypothetical protein
LTGAAVSTTAHADVRTEAAALAAQKKAQKDFMSKKYGAGITKLQNALKACGKKKCSDEVRASVMMDLGALEFRKGNKKGAAKTWGTALGLAPSATLGATYDVPDIRQALDDTRGPSAGGGGGGAAGGGGGGTAGGAAGGGGTEPSTGAGGASTETPEKAEKGEGEKTGGEKTEGGEKAEGQPAEGEKPAENAEESALGAGGGQVHHFWVGLAGTLEFTHLPAGQDLCVLNTTSGGGLGSPHNNESYYCTWNGGQDFPPRNAQGVQINGDLQHPNAGNVKDSFAIGNLRLYLTVDYALSQNFIVGARLGASLFTFPGSATGFGRFYAEGRATYLVGSKPLSGALAPLFFAGLGAAEFDASATDNIVLAMGAGQGPVQIWRVGGPFFIDVGAGLRFGTERIGVTAAARANFALGSAFIVTVGPEVGVQYGF